MFSPAIILQITVVIRRVEICLFLLCLKAKIELFLLRETCETTSICIPKQLSERNLVTRAPRLPSLFPAITCIVVIFQDIANVSQTMSTPAGYKE